MKRYELISHTADLGIKVYGKTREELSCNAAYAMFDLITELKKVPSTPGVEIAVYLLP